MAKFFRASLGILFTVFLAVLFINIGAGIYPDFLPQYSSEISLNTFAKKSDYVYVGGMPIGMTLNSQGVIVIGLTEILTADGYVTPSKDAKIIPGDILTDIAGCSIENVLSLDNIINQEQNIGQKLNLTYIRNNTKFETEICPAKDTLSGRCKLGLWIRDSAAGIGTLTFIRKNQNGYSFGALGHPICDPDTYTVVPVKKGEIFKCSIVGVTKSMKGAPGEIKGVFLKDKKKLGKIIKNNKFGVFGTVEELIPNPLYPKPLEVGARKNVKPGKAKIVTTIGDQTDEYDIEIIKTNYQKSSDEKSLIIRITDTELLKKTGGIVQGMSGSPIIQNGKIIGAVTHVFINDPTKGFGVYLDWMLKE